MFEKIEQKKVFLEILEQLKREISSGTLKTGEKLPSERDMAEKLSVSRASVREAVRALEILGLIRCQQGDGNYLVDDIKASLVEPMSFMFALSGCDITTAQQLRSALELKAVELAARRCKVRDIDMLNKIVDKLSEGANRIEMANVDRELHFAIADLSGNPLIISTLNAASSLVEGIITEIRASMINEPEGVAEFNRQHKAIIKALSRNDADMAVKEMKNHMDLVSEYIINISK